MALGLFFSFYVYSIGLASVGNTRLRSFIESKCNFYFILNKLRMRNNTIHYPMGEKAMLMFMHFTDVLITGGLLYGFLSSIGDWQAGIYLGVFIMFAILRGASLLEDIQSKRETRRKTKIENDQQEWEHQQKRLPKN